MGLHCSNSSPCVTSSTELNGNVYVLSNQVRICPFEKPLKKCCLDYSLDFSCFPVGELVSLFTLKSLSLRVSYAGFTSCLCLQHPGVFHQCSITSTSLVYLVSVLHSLSCRVCQFSFGSALFIPALFPWCFLCFWFSLWVSPVLLPEWMDSWVSWCLPRDCTTKLDLW